MPSSPSSPICRLDCPPGRPQALAILILLVAALSAVVLCGLPAALKAGAAVVAAGYGMVNAVPLWRRPAAGVQWDAEGALWHESPAGRVRLHSARWHDFGYLIRLEARSESHPGRRRLFWFTAAMDAGQRRALRLALNAEATPAAKALPATVANPLL